MRLDEAKSQIQAWVEVFFPDADFSVVSKTQDTIISQDGDGADDYYIVGGGKDWNFLFFDLMSAFQSGNSITLINMVGQNVCLLPERGKKLYIRDCGVSPAFEDTNLGETLYAGDSQIPVFSGRNRRVTNMPNPAAGVAYLVPESIASHLSGRNDIYGVYPNSRAGTLEVSGLVRY